MALKTLHTLVKLHKRRVDVLRREMIALEEERRQLLELASNLKREYANEMKIMTAEPKVGNFFAAYSKRIKKKQTTIAEEVKRLETAIEAKTEAIRTEFGEQKKYEVAREHAKKRLAEEAQRRVQQRFDEIGAQQYRKARETLA